MGIGLTWIASMLPTLMTRAGSSWVPARASASTNAWTSQNGDLRLRSITLSHAESGKVANGSPQVAPALLTRMSSRSVSARTSSARRRHSSCRDRSAGIARTSPNGASSAAACVQAAALRELMTTRAPACSRSPGHHHADASGTTGHDGGLTGQCEQFLERRGRRVCSHLPNVPSAPRAEDRPREIGRVHMVVATLSIERLRRPCRFQRTVSGSEIS